MSKSRDAFRTISEVSDVLDTPAHVLRFWESKFTQVKPVKRAGGRRYYRPTDVDLLAGIKQLLHEDGMTIKGAQKLLREKGVKHVGAIGAAILSSDDDGAIDAPEAIAQDAPSNITEPATPITEPEPEAAKPEPVSEPEPELNITNVVPLATPKVGPALSLSLTPKAPAPETPVNAPTPAETAPAAATSVDIPDDPSDSDSKAPARIFHLLHKASPEKLSARADDIAPLLSRLKDLRHRIAAR